MKPNFPDTNKMSSSDLRKQKKIMRRRKTHLFKSGPYDKHYEVLLTNLPA